MKKYFILASLTLLCCMFFSCSSDDDAEKELDLTGTWYLSSYDEYDEDDDKVTTITVSKVDATRKKIFTKRAGQVYDVQSINRHYIPNELGYIDYENPQLGDWDAENGRYPPTQNGDIRSLFMLFALMAMQN